MKASSPSRHQGNHSRFIQLLDFPRKSQAEGEMPQLTVSRFKNDNNALQQSVMSQYKQQTNQNCADELSDASQSVVMVEHSKRMNKMGIDTQRSSINFQDITEGFPIGISGIGPLNDQSEKSQQFALKTNPLVEDKGRQMRQFNKSSIIQLMDENDDKSTVQRHSIESLSKRRQYQKNSQDESHEASFQDNFAMGALLGDYEKSEYTPAQSLVSGSSIGQSRIVRNSEPNCDPRMTLQSMLQKRKTLLEPIREKEEDGSQGQFKFYIDDEDSSSHELESETRQVYEMQYGQTIDQNLAALNVGTYSGGGTINSMNNENSFLVHKISANNLHNDSGMNNTLKMIGDNDDDEDIHESFNLSERSQQSEDNFQKKVIETPKKAHNNVGLLLKTNTQVIREKKQDEFTINQILQIVEKKEKKPITKPIVPRRTNIYDRKSLYIFEEDLYLRQLITQVVDSKNFENLIILVIIANSLLLAFYDYSDRDSNGDKNKAIDQANLAFSIIFIIEALMKIIAYGFIMHENAYLRSGWNVIDAIVVLSGILEISIMTSVKLKSLRVMRVLRPLRTINALPGMKKLIAALISSISEFAKVFAFLIFVFILFATIGLHQYNGQFYNACRIAKEPVNGKWEIFETDRVCSQSGLGYFQCPAGYYCGNPSEYPELDYSQQIVDMQEQPHLNYGITNFNHIGSSLLTVFQIITSDTWYQLLCNMMDVDIPAFGGIYIFLMIVIGRFFLMNLFLAVIVFAFIKSSKLQIHNDIIKLKAEQDGVKLINEQKDEQVSATNTSGITDKIENSKKGKNMHKMKTMEPIFSQSHKPNKKQTRRRLVTSKTANKIQEKSQKFSLQDDTPKAEPQIKIEKLVQNDDDDSEILHELLKPTVQRKRRWLKSQRTQRMHQVANDYFKNEEQSAEHVIDLIQEDGSSSNIFTKKKESKLDKNISNQKSKTLMNKAKPSNHYLLESIDDFKGSPEKQQDSNNEGGASLLKLVKMNTQLNKGEEPQPFNLGLEQALKVQIEDQYDGYFKNKIGDQQTYTSAQSTMRELVSIKIGLEYIQSYQERQKQKELQLIEIQKRLGSHQVFQRAYNLVQSSSFTWLITLIIAINTILLSLDKYPEDRDITQLVEKLNIAFVLFFTLELIIKLLAFSCSQFFKSGTFINVFDAIIVIAGLIDVALSSFIVKESGEAKQGSLFTLLRVFRLLRIFKLASRWRRFDLLIETLGKSLRDIAYFIIFLVLFIYVFTLLGMELFAFQAKIKGGASPDQNFDTFLNSFSLVFMLLTNDSTSSAYYTHYRLVSPVSSSFFFIFIILFGQRVVINIFVAILLENFQEGQLKERILEYEKEVQEGGEDQSMLERLLKSGVACITYVKTLFESLRKKLRKDYPFCKKYLKKQILKPESNPYLQGDSLLFFSSESELRKQLFSMLFNRTFEISLLIVILISSIELALERPTQTQSMKNILFFVNAGTTLIFVIEILCKAIICGLLFNGDKSYLRQGWSQVMEVLVIIVAVVGLISGRDSHLQVFKVFMLFRLVKDNQGLIVIARALREAIPNIVNVTLMMLLFFLVVGIFLVSQFKGKFYYCFDSLSQAVDSKWDCLNTGGQWLNKVYNFDSIPLSLLSLFIIATSSQSYPSILLDTFTAPSSIDYVSSSSNNNNPFWTIFFIVFIILTQFFFLKLYVGVIVATFNSEVEKQDDLLSHQQKEWVDLKLLVLQSVPILKIKRPSEGCIKQVCFDIQAHSVFDKLISLTIVLNSLLLTLRWYQQPAHITFILDVLNYIFTGIFLVEALLKIVGRGAKLYFLEVWNVFDFVIAVGSLAAIIVSFYSTLQIKGTITLLRAFRILRIMRLVKRGGRFLQVIFNTFLITLQPLLSVGGLLLLIIYMYSILGMIIFGEGCINGYLCFETFPHAFFTMFTVMTGDSWSLIQQSFLHFHINHNLTIAYFISFVFLVNILFMQLFIAVILRGYDDTQIQEARLFNNERTQHFREVWADFDTEATAYIEISRLRELIKALGEPLGLAESLTKYQEDQFIAQLELPIHKEFKEYSFFEVLDALSFRLMVLEHIKQRYQEDNHQDEEYEIDPEFEYEVKMQIQNEVNSLLEERKKNGSELPMFMKQQQKIVSESGFTSSHHMAAEAAVRKFKAFVARNKGKTNKTNNHKTLPLSDQKNHFESTSEQQLELVPRHQARSNIQQMKTPPSNKNHNNTGSVAFTKKDQQRTVGGIPSTTFHYSLTSSSVTSEKNNSFKQDESMRSSYQEGEDGQSKEEVGNNGGQNRDIIPRSSYPGE